jgi:hypothetical protein
MKKKPTGSTPFEAHYVAGKKYFWAEIALLPLGSSLGSVPFAASFIDQTVAHTTSFS